MMATMTDIAALVVHYQGIRAHLAAQDELYAKYKKPYLDDLAKIEAEITAAMAQQNLKSVRTDTGTAILSEIATPRIPPEHRDAYLDWCMDNWDTFGGEMLQVGAPKVDAVRAYMDAHEGRLPPNVEMNTTLRFSVRKA